MICRNPGLLAVRPEEAARSTETMSASYLIAATRPIGPVALPTLAALLLVPTVEALLANAWLPFLQCSLVTWLLGVVSSIHDFHRLHCLLCVVFISSSLWWLNWFNFVFLILWKQGRGNWRTVYYCLFKTDNNCLKNLLKNIAKNGLPGSVASIY